MSKVKSYHVITAVGTNDLNEKVNTSLREGWQPIGGVTVTVVDDPTNLEGKMVTFC